MLELILSTFRTLKNVRGRQAYYGVIFNIITNNNQRK